MDITLPTSIGGTEHYRLRGEPLVVEKPSTPFNRVAFAAAHVVADVRADTDASGKPAFDWDGTLAYRRHLLGLGFNIAEAMDTSQRGMGLDWPSALALITRSLADAGDESDRIYCGIGTDQLAPADARSNDDVIRAYGQQFDAVQKLGGRCIMMASRALARVATSPKDYINVYSRVLAHVDHPVILHWLGDMFDPALAGYWGGSEFERAMDTCLCMIEANAGKIDGIKISLLDEEKEVTMRRRLPASVKMYTGDDFNYPSLIAGDEQGYSHALLGIFDAIAPVASLALQALAHNDMARYAQLLEPTVPLSRLMFRAPTQNYKTGIVFLAWLNGHQDHFIMINGAQGLRPLPYFTEVFKLADQAHLFRDPALAVARMRQLLGIYGL
jgi:hypothetical protein